MIAAVPAPCATRTTCPYCGVGCGVLATPDGRGGAAISGDGEHPANFGRLCSKGSALGETSDALWYLEMIRNRKPVAAIRKEMMFGRSLATAPKAA